MLTRRPTPPPYGTASVGFPPSFQPFRPSDITATFV